ncbi:hypothetical protein Y900_025490 [Mycolicibacterium aromaticivorans JS19b1 = JCM 16368]|uniref:Restriction endonuclease type IV Mrr domain-containing protein n=1 Tax=Mycolicibacterium aromaticivorans JS19b1 = JCM 16368 TaxID=1440774 RepID=A0A064CTZ9_9MYCO|nr:restriction endonuclease [Mycolicibacterium aromaticivorans]KDF02194.1 hypothetical protein Y900_025490 [Mycolicibacterium aromaticivorans JS19b1 = JCM 16368]
MDGPLGVQLDLERLCPVLSDVPIEVTRPLYQLLSSERVHHRKLRAHLAERERHLAYMNSGMREIDAMPGVEFERYIAARYRADGWTVRHTPASGDYGVDLIATKDGELDLAIQCKRQAKPVGVSAIQQVVAGGMHYGCARTMVTSNQEFTPAARNLAATHNCQLIGRAELLETIWIDSPGTDG